MASDHGYIIPKEDFLFRVRDPDAPHLADFLQHQAKMEYYRAETTGFDGELFGLGGRSQAPSVQEASPPPDTLSKMRDYEDGLELTDFDLRTSSAILLAHKGLMIEDYLDLAVKVPKAAKGRMPACSSQLDFSMADYQHLPAMANRESLSSPPETRLEAMVWPKKPDGKRFSTERMGELLFVALAKNEKSWVLYNLAALVWRIRGDAYQAIECLRRSLHYSPFHLRDMALLSLANVLYNAGAPNEALVVVEAAVDACDTVYASHVTRGNILAGLGEYVNARDSYARAVQLNPDLQWGRELLEAITVRIKVDAVAQRRRSEIALRKVTMVLTEDLTWEDFDYEAIDKPCLDAVCKENAQCSNVDGKCHCNEGYLAVNGECAPDTQCETDATHCKDNSVCRAGRCYCKVGFMVRDNACVTDPCAGIACVDHAVCNSDSGRCECNAGFQASGAECVTADCVGVSCKQFSFCQKGLCYCHVGYHPNYDMCVPDEPCAKSRCPKNASCCKDDGHCRCDNGFMADIHNNLCLPEDMSMAAGSLVEEYSVAGAGSGKMPPSMLMSGQQSDLLPEVQPFEEADWATAASCTPAMRTLPEWNDYASTFLPPTSRHGRSVRDLLDLQADMPEDGTLLEPRCDLVGEPLQSAHTMDHIVGIVDRFEETMNAKYQPETGLKEIAAHLLGFNMDYRELGHRIAAALGEVHDSWILYSLASLYWRVVGNAGQALECVRKSLHYSSYEDKDVAMINAANVLHRGGRLQDATTFAHLALLMSTRQKTITHFTLANVLAAREMWDDAAFHYEQSLRHQPGFELALHTLKRIRCVQLLQGGGPAQKAEAAPVAPATTAADDAAATAAEVVAANDAQLQIHLKEAHALRLRLLALKRLMEEHGSDTPDAARMRLQLSEAERKLDAVLSRQPASFTDVLPDEPMTGGLRPSLPPLTVQAVAPSSTGAGDAASDLSSLAAEASSAATGAAAKQYTDKNGQRVIVVEYPSSPSISSLISAVEEMMDGEADQVPQVFDDPGWPELELCRAHGVRAVDFSSTLMPVEAKGVNTSEHVNLHIALVAKPEDFQPPLCTGPVPEKKVHTLQHLRGVASREELVMPPEGDLAAAVQMAHGRIDPMPLDEFGERVRLGLQLNSTSWVLQNLAAVYWRILGNATQSVECLRRAFHYSASSNKDVSLIGLANVLHLSGHTIDAITVMQMAIQVAPRAVLNHLTMANILAAIGERGAEEASFFFETTLRFQDFAPALEKLKTIRCRQVLKRGDRGP